MNANINISESHLSGPVDLDWKIAEAKKAVLHYTARLIAGYENPTFDAEMLASYSKKLAALMTERDA